MTRIVLLTLGALALTACADSDDTDDTDVIVDQGDLEIVGTYADTWGTLHTIDDTMWTQNTSMFHLESWDNDAGVVIAHNDDDNEYNPGLFSRFDWTETSEGLWYCQTAYDAATVDAAEATDAADATDPSTAGCGGFSWTRLVEPLSVRGDWVDNWGGEHSIHEGAWAMNTDTTFHVIDFDNDAGTLIAQNSADNEYFPSLYSRFDYAQKDSTWYFCQGVYDGNTEQDARDGATPDASDPANSGCGDFAWSTLSAN